MGGTGVGFFKDSIRILGLDMDSLADDVGRPLDRGQRGSKGSRSDVDRLLSARSIGGRRIVREGGFTFIDGRRVRRDGPYTYVGNDRIRVENGMTFIGDKLVTRDGGFLYVDGEQVEE